MSLLENSNLTQHVSFPTHQHGHILDLVITTKDSTLLPSITHSLISPSDHFPIFTSLPISPPTPPPLLNINMNKFIHDIHTSILSHPPNNLYDLVDCYNKTLSDLLNKHAPLAQNHTTHTIQNSLSHIQVTAIQTAFFYSRSLS